MADVERIGTRCDRCEHEADFAYVNGRWHVSSFSDRCDKGTTCLRGWAEEWECAPWVVLDNPRPYLEATGAHIRPNGHGYPPASLPTRAQLAEWRRRLRANDDGALDYLLTRISRRSVARYGFGYDGLNLTLPIHAADGSLLNVRGRRPGPGEPFRGLAGRGSQWFPDVPPEPSVLVLAGEFDVVQAREAGLPAVTTTCGASLPSHLVSPLVTKRVAVAYDVGEEAAAKRTVAKLLEVGSDAWVVDLGRLGLEHGGDLSDYFGAGGTPRELIRLIRSERRAAG